MVLGLLFYGMVDLMIKVYLVMKGYLKLSIKISNDSVSKVTVCAFSLGPFDL